MAIFRAKNTLLRKEHVLRQGDAHEFMRFVYRIEIIDALKPIVHLFELPCLPLTGLDLISFLL